jgi:1,2-diacylglycerol 3-alpha-glucosyltransferase
MKVVFTHTDFRIYWPHRLAALNDFLTDKGIRLDIIEIAGAGSPYRFSKKDNNHGSNWHCLFPDLRMEDIRICDANKVLRKKLDDINPDIVFAGAIAYPSGASAVRWASDNAKKVVIFDNARLADVPRPRRVDFVKRKIYECADAIFCPSPAWNDTFNYFGFQNERIFYGLNVVNNSFWQSDKEPEFSLYPNHDYFLSVGRQVPKKNFLFLLKAYLEYTKLTNRPKDLILVGEGQDHELIEEFVNNTKLETVILLPFKSQPQLRELYKNASSFVFPSKYGETWGLVVNEAMASGLPILVSNQVGCSSTLVKDGINGYEFSPFNGKQLSDLMLLMSELSEHDRIRMGQKSKEIIADWDLDRFCKGTYEAISWVSEHQKQKHGLLNRLILKLWQGRYRPT